MIEALVILTQLTAPIYPEVTYETVDPIDLVQCVMLKDIEIEELQAFHIKRYGASDATYTNSMRIIVEKQELNGIVKDILEKQIPKHHWDSIRRINFPYLFEWATVASDIRVPIQTQCFRIYRVIEQRMIDQGKLNKHRMGK